MNQLEELTKQLSDNGMKEAAEIAIHSDTIEDFISYMQFDIDERTKALQMAEQLTNKN